MNKSKMKSSFGSNAVSFLLCIVGGLLIAFLIHLIPLYEYTVRGTSMFPSYEDGDIVTTIPIDKNVAIERFDVVIISPTPLSPKLIKRVVALPKETIQIDSFGRIIVNDFELSEEYIYTRGLITPFTSQSTNEITLSDDEYFAIGDNTGESNDSRAFGPIKLNQITAIVKN